MPGTLVEKAACETCGTEVRENSTFCYNCGESVVEPPAPPILKPDTGTLNGGDSTGAKTLTFADPEPAPIAMPESTSSEGFGSQPGPPASGVPTAFPRRKRPVKKVAPPVEVEWVEHSGSSVLFIVGSVVVALAAIGLLVLAAYLR